MEILVKTVGASGNWRIRNPLSGNLSPLEYLAAERITTDATKMHGENRFFHRAGI